MHAREHSRVASLLFNREEENHLNLAARGHVEDTGYISIALYESSSYREMRAGETLEAEGIDVPPLDPHS